MDYNNPTESGRKAFLKGSSRDSNPVDYRTNANAHALWISGWDKQSKVTCKGENCTAIRGVGHSDECANEHEEAYRPEIARLKGLINES